MFHGATQAMKIHEASTTPASERFPARHRRCQIHNPDTGRNASREVLVSAEMPQSRPKAAHGRQPPRSSMSSVSQKISASKNAARLVSQTQRVHQYITDGSRAHSHPLQTATFSSKTFRAIRKMGMQVSAENRLLIESRITADAGVYTPVILNTEATRNG